MSILVKGMDMPEKCGLCNLFHAESPMHCTVIKGHKTVGAPYGMPRPEWCPLFEVKTPHGNLVDIDAMIERFWDGDYMEIHSRDLVDIPVIVEAEENHE